MAFLCSKLSIVPFVVLSTALWSSGAVRLMQSFYADVLLIFGFFALNDLFREVQTSIFFCYFLFFTQWFQSSRYSVLLSHRLVHFSYLTMPHSWSQITQDECHSQFFDFCFSCIVLAWLPLQPLYFRSRCIWWNLSGASSATCAFTSC